MWKNYLKIAWRNLVSDKWYTLINASGLTVGFVCLLFISLYIIDEFSYDRFFGDSDRIYRVNVTTTNSDGQHEYVATSPQTMAYTLQADLSEIEVATSLLRNGEQLVQYGDRGFYESRLFQADSNFFEVFSFRFLAGSKSNPLSKPDEIILTETTAKKYFGEEDPIGKPMFLETIGEYVVSAVVEDPAVNSHLLFDLLIPHRVYEERESYDWGNNNFHTYFKLLPNAESGNVTDQIQALAAKYKPRSQDRYSIFPLQEIHLSGLGLKGELESGGSRTTLGMLALIAVFAMVLACINYINLTTAKGSKRSREIGVRKTSGASRSSLIYQFLTESLLLTLGAFVLAVLLMNLLKGSFGEISGKELDLFNNEALALWFLLTGLAVLIGVVAGVYPALVLSGLNPVRALKGQLGQSQENSGPWIGNLLIGLQFTIATGLIFCTLVIYTQLEFVHSSETGYDREQVLVLPNIRGVSNKEVLKERLSALAQVVGVGASTSSIGMPTWTGNIRTESSEAFRLINFTQVDYGFIDALGMRLVEGRNFSPSVSTDTISAIVINQKAAEDLGLSEPVVGRRLVWNENSDGKAVYAEVIGVVEDFHYNSFHEPIKPFAFLVRNWHFVQYDFMSKLFIKMNTEDLQSTTAEVEAIWDELVPNGPFTYYFLDEAVENLYLADMRFRSLFTWLTAVVMLIAGIGLFALVSYQVERRIKEIGIRKVLGASVFTIVSLISKPFLIPVAVAILIALPVAWIGMGGWLGDFAYRIELQPWMLMVSGVLGVLLALASIVVQSVKAALMNPVDSLRSE